MRAAVAEAEDGSRVAHHRERGFQAIVRVVQEREQDQRLAVVGEKPIVGEFFGALVPAGGLRAQAHVGRRLIVWRIGEREHFGEVAQHGFDERVVGCRFLRQEACAHLGRAHGGKTFGEG